MQVCCIACPARGLYSSIQRIVWILAHPCTIKCCHLARNPADLSNLRASPTIKSPEFVGYCRARAHTNRCTLLGVLQDCALTAPNHPFTSNGSPLYQMLVFASCFRADPALPSNVLNSGRFIFGLVVNPGVVYQRNTSVLYCMPRPWVV